MSQFADTTDAIVALLVDTDELADAKQHRYAPWSVERLFAQPNEIHLAVWPEGEGETAESLATGAHELTQVYEVWVWADASKEGTRRLDDDAANQDWLELFETLRALWYHDDRQTLGAGNVVQSWYVGGTFGVQGSTRWFQQQIRVKVHQAFIP